MSYSMGYLTGYIGMHFLLAFLFVYFVLKKSYLKKNKFEMTDNQLIIRTIVVGCIILVLRFILKCFL